VLTNRTTSDRWNMALRKQKEPSIAARLSPDFTI
jgi:hypothetical protein